MSEERRDRIIRYTYLSNGLLSLLDDEKNILFIDIEQNARLTPAAQNRLPLTDYPETVVVHTPHGYNFELYK